MKSILIRKSSVNNNKRRKF